jgi:hypothetical protein
VATDPAPVWVVLIVSSLVGAGLFAAGMIFGKWILT